MKCDFVQILMQINANEQKILIKKFIFSRKSSKKKESYFIGIIHLLLPQFHAYLIGLGGELLG